MIRTFVYILLWLLIMSVAIFASQNLTLITIKLLAWESVRLPLGLVLVACAGAGGVLVTFLQVRGRANRRQFTDRPGRTGKRVKSAQSSAAFSQSSQSKRSRSSKQSSGSWQDDWLEGKENDDWV
jgi:uncharacterized integral membrane protein